MIPVTYISSAGNTYQLHTKDGVLHKRLPYRSWSWKVRGTDLEQGTRVSGFTRAAAQYKSELLFFGTKEEQTELVNDLHDDFEGDLRRVQTGRIIVEDQYIDCYITAVDARYKDGCTTDSIQIYAPYPFWRQEQVINLSPSAEQTSGFLDFPFDFPFDFTAPTSGRRIVHSEFPFESEYKMVIYGLAVNPRIVVNGYAYVLYATIPEGAYVIIDSRAKTIMMYNSNGTKTDLFNFRNKTNSIFKKIPAGNLDISWDASYGADLTIYRERSEPKGALA